MQKINGYTVPYKGKRSCNFSYTEYGNRPGVYLIKENTEIVYVGMSKSCVYKAMYRHFQSWNDPHFDRVVYPISPKYTCTIFLTEEATELEKKLIRDIQPRDNKERYEIYEDEPEERDPWMIQPDEVPF